MRFQVLAAALVGCSHGGLVFLPTQPPSQPLPPAAPAAAPIATPVPPAPPGLPCFAEAEHISLDGGNISTVKAGDFDGDGAPDLVVVHDDADLAADRDYVSVLRNDGRGKLRADARWQADKGTLEVTPIDLDRDGVLDLVTSAVVFDGTVATSLRIYHGRGGGQFASGKRQSTGKEAHAEGAADFTGDGLAELVITTANTVDVYAVRGGGFARHERVRAGRYPHAMAAADLDADGDLDMVFLNHNSYELMVATNRGAGRFTAARALQTCVAPSMLQLVDFDRDGKLDAVMSCLGMTTLVDGELAPSRLGVVSNVGAAGAVFAPLADGFQYFVAGDFTGDAASDVVAFDAEIRSRVALLAGSGRAVKQIGSVEIDGQLGQPLAVDLDRDGKLDVVAPLWRGRPPGQLVVWHGRACAATTHH